MSHILAVKNDISTLSTDFHIQQSDDSSSVVLPTVHNVQNLESQQFAILCIECGTTAICPPFTSFHKIQGKMFEEILIATYLDAFVITVMSPDTFGIIYFKGFIHVYQPNFKDRYSQKCGIESYINWLYSTF